MAPVPTLMVSSTSSKREPRSYRAFPAAMAPVTTAPPTARAPGLIAASFPPSPSAVSAVSLKPSIAPFASEMIRTDKIALLPAMGVCFFLEKVEGYVEVLGVPVEPGVDGDP